MQQRQHAKQDEKPSKQQAKRMQQELVVQRSSPIMGRSSPMEGMAGEVAEVLFDSAAWLIGRLQRELQLETSTDKSEMLASTPWLARALHRCGRTLGIRLTAAARLLVIDVSGASRDFGVRQQKGMSRWHCWQ